MKERDGVYFDRKHLRWSAYGRSNGKRVYVGYANTQTGARRLLNMWIAGRFTI